jgi:hypothetical protein
MATQKHPPNLNRHWLRKWLRGEPHIIIGEGPDPYLYRWFVIPRNRFLNVYLHKFLRSDDDRALHDHPWPFFSWLLKGEYLEYAGTPPNPHPRRRWSVAYRPAKWLHRVALVCRFNPDGTYGEQPAWTLIVTGPKIRDWGFLCPKGWVHWEVFDSNNGCGEFS